LKHVLSIALLILGSLISCKEEKKEQDSTEASQLKSMLNSEDADIIHGTTLGDDIQYVMNTMKPHIVSEMPDEITTRIPLDLKDSTFYDIDYDFKSGKLYSIDLDIYPKTTADLDILFNEFMSFYDKYYGKGKSNNGYVVWYTKSKTGEDVEISMIDESAAHQKPYLAISFYQEQGIAD